MRIKYRNTIGAVLGSKLDEASARIRQMNAADMASTTPADIVDDELARVVVKPLKFHFEARGAQTEPQTRTKQVNDPFGRPRTFEYVEYVISVPFTGTAWLIDHEPTGAPLDGRSLSVPLENALVDGSTVDIYIEVHEQDPDMGSATLSNQLALAESWLTQQAEFANDYAARWLEMARETLTNDVAKRQRSADATSSVLKAVGIPLLRADNPIPVTRTAKPLHHAAIASRVTAVPAPEYSLTDDIYNDIIATIEGLGLAAERLPTTSQKLTEEDLRNVILFVLNANYQGRAVGEAFSGAGKTDILLMWEGQAAFIGECKIWHGQAKFLEAIDQLFRYTTWRDTRGAVIVFADADAMTRVQQTAAAAIQAHPHWVRDLGAGRHLMTHPKDNLKQVTVALLFVAATLKDPDTT